MTRCGAIFVMNDAKAVCGSRKGDLLEITG